MLPNDQASMHCIMTCVCVSNDDVYRVYCAPCIEKLCGSAEVVAVSVHTHTHTHTHIHTHTHTHTHTYTHTHHLLFTCPQVRETEEWSCYMCAVDNPGNTAGLLRRREDSHRKLHELFLNDIEMEYVRENAKRHQLQSFLQDLKALTYHFSLLLCLRVCV